MFVLRSALTAVRAVGLLTAPHIIFRQLLTVCALQISFELGRWALANFRVLDYLSRSRSATRRIREQLASARTFSEWECTAQFLDAALKNDAWKADSSDVPFRLDHLVSRTREYNAMRASRDVYGLMFRLRSELLRKHWGIGGDEIARAYVGTKACVEEVCDAAAAPFRQLSLPS